MKDPNQRDDDLMGQAKTNLNNGVLWDQRSVSWRRWPFLAMVAIAVVFSSGCSSRFLITTDQSSLLLNEFERRTITVRLIDAGGNPLEGRRVRFYLEGNANGGQLESFISQTDPGGVASTVVIAQFEANFSIGVKADGADDIKLQAVVSRDAGGGSLRLTVYTRSAASLADATLTLVEGFDCSAFDPERPPAPDPQSPAPTKDVVASPAGSTVLFSGFAA